MKVNVSYSARQNTLILHDAYKLVISCVTMQKNLVVFWGNIRLLGNIPYKDA